MNDRVFEFMKNVKNVKNFNKFLERIGKTLHIFGGVIHVKFQRAVLGCLWREGAGPATSKYFKIRKTRARARSEF